MDPCMQTPPRAAWQAASVALLCALVAACGGGGRGDDNGPVTIRTVSNRADLVSDGDALVEITAPPGISRDGMNVALNGADVSAAFVEQGRGRFLGLVTGLAAGANTLTTTAKANGALGARLTITNASRGGPVFSGPQLAPYYCATPTAQAAAGSTPATNESGLSGMPDAGCNIATEYKVYYRTTTAAQSAANPSGCSTGLPDPSAASNGVTGVITPATPPANPCWKTYVAGSSPADMATARTSDGLSVPFVVRVERGTMNRGIYDIVVLFDPAKAWTPLSPQTTWNRKIYYSFGSSTGQPRRQSRTTVNWTTLEAQLAAGYLVAQNSMTDSSRNSNRVLMTETTMMMKEHIIDRYGPAIYTLGTGCSGGSINSNMNLSIMPGVLDGVVTTCTYPDSETTSLEVSDCTLLVEAYQRPEMLNAWSGLLQSDINARKAAINGHQDQTGCQAWFNLFGSNGKAGVYKQRTVTDHLTGAITQAATPTNNCELPNVAVYDPMDPATANFPRCNAWAWGESIWGRAGGGTQARDTRDNVGVQYGLGALLAGAITAEEFVVLNEIIGGTDRDSTPRAQRSVADQEALAIAYRSGIVASGANLAKAAILDLRGWDDSLANLPPDTIAPPSAFSPVFGIHHQWFSFAIRDRIARDAGTSDSQAMWRFARGGMVPSATLAAQATSAMDAWLTALVTDPSNRPIERKVRAARPDSTRDFCYLSGDASQSFKVFDPATCDADPYLRPAASPRQVAGGPRSEDILKCQRKPLSPAGYPGVLFTTGQWTRLEAVFASGVCDWSKPGVGQQAAQSPLTFQAGPGGQPLGDAPRSTPL